MTISYCHICDKVHEDTRRCQASAAAKETHSHQTTAHTALCFNGEPEAPAPIELRAVANEPDAEVVKQIESLLARAKSGEVRAVALASVNADGSCGTAWAGDRWAALLGISFELLCRLREEGKPAETPSR